MMRFPKVKIWKAASTNEPMSNPARDALRHIRYDVENNVLIATDGFVMAIVACESETPSQSANISRKAIKDAYRQKCSLSFGDDYVEMPDGTMHPFIGGTADYPDYRKIVEYLSDDENSYKVYIDVDLLTRLVSAIDEVKPGDGRRVTLVIDKNDIKSPIRVIPHSPTTAWGIVMPAAQPVEKRRYGN